MNSTAGQSFLNQTYTAELPFPFENYQFVADFNDASIRSDNDFKEDIGTGLSLSRSAENNNGELNFQLTPVDKATVFTTAAAITWSGKPRTRWP